MENLPVNNSDLPVFHRHPTNFCSIILSNIEEGITPMPRMTRSSSLGGTAQFLMEPVK